jgi:transcription-repair coupling factor (superfamily II helicase)
VGFEWPEGEIAFITEGELYAGVVRRTAREAAKRSNVDAMVRDLSEVRIGDPVVHEEHGIGRYLGLLTLDLGDGSNEFLQLVYANDAKLYVPVSNLHLISRYSGASPDAAPLHELGSGQWEKAKKKAAQQAHDTAAELLNLYTQRAARQGHMFTLKPHDYEAFAEGFGFAETPDQAAAIDAVVKDMTSGKAMDRLVCGDVGFGKTEVALRAAFVALADGKQVAILVPTTLLAEQHFQTFTDRFSDTPVRIAELSRFRSAKETKLALEGLATGKIDLVIGTHKLLQSDVKFKDLGLVIIDEEHRFGVRQKELLKRLRAEVDVLTLTATPIPRTLAMSLEGIRDFSVIATAPERRLSIKTFVASYSPGIVREAALRELKRGGQIYFLHNEVDTIATRAETLAKLLPEARIAVAHGQMAERELEQVMRDFYQQRVNLLLCSTIIETGIDVPTANTIIIDRADKFGLAQLHQLRGRVGRSHHQAYAYLLTPPWDALAAQAKKRLEAIQMMEDLGSGFYLAMHDLEIRGAGEVLGDEQSGEMQEVGFQLYNDMLRSSVSALKSGASRTSPSRSASPPRSTCTCRPSCPSGIATTSTSGSCCTSGSRAWNRSTSSTRSRRSSSTASGPRPTRRRRCLPSHRLRLLARPLGVRKVDAGPERTTIQFVKHPPFDTGALILMVQKDGRIRFAGTGSRAHRACRSNVDRAHRPRAGFPGQAPLGGAHAPAAASARARPRLAVGQQRAAARPRRSRADRFGLLDARAAHTCARRPGARRRAARAPRQHARTLRPRRRQRGDQAGARVPDRVPCRRGRSRRPLGHDGAAVRLCRPARSALRCRRALACRDGRTYGATSSGACSRRPATTWARSSSTTPSIASSYRATRSGRNGYGFVMPQCMAPRHCRRRAPRST